MYLITHSNRFLIRSRGMGNRPYFSSHFYMFLSEVPLTFAGCLSELQEHANLMAAVKMRNLWPKKPFPVIGLKNGLDRLLHTLFPYESAKRHRNLKTLIELALQVPVFFLRAWPNLRSDPACY